MCAGHAQERTHSSRNNGRIRLHESCRARMSGLVCTLRGGLAVICDWRVGSCSSWPPRNCARALVARFRGLALARRCGVDAQYVRPNFKGRAHRNDIGSTLVCRCRAPLFAGFARAR